jgi:hypothetical protein
MQVRDLTCKLGVLVEYLSVPLSTSALLRRKLRVASSRGTARAEARAVTRGMLTSCFRGCDTIAGSCGDVLAARPTELASSTASL